MSPIAGVVRQIENVLSNPVVEVFETGNDMLDVVPNPVVVRDQTLPINRAAVSQRRFCQTTYDGRFALQKFARGLRVTSRRIDDSRSFSE